MSRTRSPVRVSLSLVACGCCVRVLMIQDAAGASYLDGQVVVDADHPEWMKRQGGGPVFICGPGDPEGFLYLGTRNADGTRSGGNQSDIINQIKGTGANCLYLMAIRSHGGDGDDSENPFVDFDATKPLDQDSTYDFKWVDCATGSVASQTGISVSAGDRTWPKPGGIGTELAVWITRTGEAGGDGGESTRGGCVPSTGGSLCCLALACLAYLAAKAVCHAGRTESPCIPPVRP